MVHKDRTNRVRVAREPSLPISFMNLFDLLYIVRREAVTGSTQQPTHERECHSTRICPAHESSPSANTTNNAEIREPERDDEPNNWDKSLTRDSLWTGGPPCSRSIPPSQTPRG